LRQAFPSALVLPDVKQLALGEAEVMDELCKRVAITY
jgi:hypothetical protein